MKVQVIKAVKAVLCPMNEQYHPIEKCQECSHCQNHAIQNLVDGQSLEYMFCSHGKDLETRLSEPAVSPKRYEYKRETYCPYNPFKEGQL